MSSVSDPGLTSNGFIIWCSAFVFLMTPGLGFFYSGLGNAKNALSNIMICMLTYSIVTIQWVLFGFSLTFSETGGPFIGNFAMGGLTGVGSNALPLTAPSIPSISFSLYQLQFATVTGAIIFGSVSERFRIIPGLIFIFFWTTAVYDFTAYWTWASHGWLRNLSCLSTLDCGIGSYDYAGGGPVHVASGFAALAYCLIVGKRKTWEKMDEPKAHNLTLVFLGTALLWFGWLGFNGGSAIASSPRAAMAALVTIISAATSGLTWTLIDYCSSHKKLSGVAFCSGAVAGLVVITPSSGFVAPWASIVIGFLSGFVIRYATHLKNYLGYDDALDAFSIHGLGGFFGNILTGIFAQKWIASLDGSVINGGWLDGNFIQIGYQFAGSLAIAGYSFVLSFILLFCINAIPGLSLRSSESEELKGVDYCEMGEVAYESVSTMVSDSTTMKEKEASATIVVV